MRGSEIKVAGKDPTEPSSNIKELANRLPENILVTGGAGYIGSVVVDRLASVGKTIIVVDNFSRGHHKAIINPGVKVIIGDVADKKLLSRIMREEKIDAVMHFAAFIEAGESMKMPERYFRNNTVGSLSLLEAMLDSGVSQIIFSSTAAVYGIPEKIPIDENMPLKPINAYGRSKLMVEEILQWFSRVHNFKSVALRYFNACGATNLGEDHQPETHLIPLAIRAVMEEQPIRIFGTDYDTRDGTCVRDYIHVDDLAEAHLIALAELGQDEGNSTHIYNLGSETGFTNREVVEAVLKVAGKNIPVEETERRPGDPPVLIASSAKIKKELGWTPKFTDLEEVIKSAYLWRVNNPRGYES